MKEVYQILSAAMGHEQRVGQIANNLANVNTVGFKRDDATFEDYLKAVQSDPNQTPAAAVQSTGASTWPLLMNGYSDYSQGPMRQTNSSLDVAIEGEGFFQVEVEGRDERFFTRAGNFALNAERELVTPSGHRVLDENGRAIQLDAGIEELVINAEGVIRQGQTEVGRLGVFRFENQSQLAKFGDSLFAAPAGVEAETMDNPTVRQGMLEYSNVRPIEEMVRMIDMQRVTETHQRVIQTIDQMTARRLDAAQR